MDIPLSGYQNCVKAGVLQDFDTPLWPQHMKKSYSLMALLEEDRLYNIKKTTQEFHSFNFV